MSTSLPWGIAIGFGLGIAAAGGGWQGGTAREQPRQPSLASDYLTFTVTAPPPELGLDPFYKKYVDAHGIPVATSEKVPDAALLMARDIVQFMLENDIPYTPPKRADFPTGPRPRDPRLATYE